MNRRLAPMAVVALVGVMFFVASPADASTPVPVQTSNFAGWSATPSVTPTTASADVHVPSFSEYCDPRACEHGFETSLTDGAGMTLKSTVFADTVCNLWIDDPNPQCLVWEANVWAEVDLAQGGSETSTGLNMNISPGDTVAESVQADAGGDAVGSVTDLNTGQNASATYPGSGFAAVSGDSGALDGPVRCGVVYSSVLFSHVMVGGAPLGSVPTRTRYICNPGKGLGSPLRASVLSRTDGGTDFTIFSRP